jgi:hypothetical protein
LRKSIIEFTMKNPLFYLKTRRKGLTTRIVGGVNPF